VEHPSAPFERRRCIDFRRQRFDDPAFDLDGGRGRRHRLVAGPAAGHGIMRVHRHAVGGSRFRFHADEIVATTRLNFFRRRRSADGDRRCNQQPGIPTMVESRRHPFSRRWGSHHALLCANGVRSSPGPADCQSPCRLTNSLKSARGRSGFMSASLWMWPTNVGCLKNPPERGNWDAAPSRPVKGMDRSPRAAWGLVRV
jgi:hypothetical protein